MKTKLLILIAVMLCVNILNADLIWVVNSQSRTLSRIDLETDLVQNTFAILGYVPNKVIVGEDVLWVVNSGDNAIQKLDKSTGAQLGNYLVELGSNPWDAIYHDGYLYISGLFTSKVYKMDAFNGIVHAEVNVGFAPEALVIAGNKLYVSNSGNYAQNYVGSSVSVIDLESFETINLIETGLNPQYLTAQGEYVYVSCTGNWTDAPGQVDVINTSTDEIIHTIALGGTPGNIYIDSEGIAWVADSSGMSLYAYDTEDFSMIYNAQNPFQIGASAVAGTQNKLAVLTPNWGSNAIVKILNSDLSIAKEFTVGMMPTDMKLEETSSVSTTDDLVVNAPLKPYPNPAHRSDHIVIKRDSASKAQVSIYNVRGQKVETYELEGTELKLDASHFPAGMYFLKITSPNQQHSGKFVVLN
nr:hypothetical protein [Candidatus Cloacimonadota bacterium]